MENDNTNTQVNSSYNPNEEGFSPLGLRLRALMQEAKLNNERINFVNLLIDMASKGHASLKFDDLRDYVPMMIQTGELFDWLDKNRITHNGAINQNTGSYEYILSWDN